MATFKYTPDFNITTLKQGDILDFGANGQFTKNAQGGFQPVNPAPGAGTPATPATGNNLNTNLNALDSKTTPPPPSSLAPLAAPGSPATIATFPSASILPSTSNSGVVTSQGAATPSSSPAPAPSPATPSVPATGPNVGFLAAALSGSSPPTPPSLTDILKTVNISGLQTGLAAIQQSKAFLQNAYTKYVLQVNGQGIPQGIVDVLTDEKAKGMQIQMDSLNTAEQTAATNLSNAMTWVNTMMTLQSTDYTNALNAYNSNFDRAYKFQDLFNSAADTQQKNASAYLGSVATMIGTGGVNWDAIDPAMKATIQQKELAAGWPAGTLESFAKVKPGANVLGTINGVDANGQNTVTFIYSNPDGKPGMMQTINTGSYKETPLQTAVRAASLERAQQTINSSKAMEANRIIGPQARLDPVLKRYNEAIAVKPRIDAAFDDINTNGINSANSKELIDGITQLMTSGNQITEGQISLTTNYQSYADKLQTLIQKIDGAGGAISPDIASQLKNLAENTYSLYKKSYSQRINVYNDRLKNVNGEDLTEFSPLTDMSNLPSVLDGSYDQSLTTQNSALSSGDLSGLSQDQIQQLVDAGLIGQ